MAPIVLASGGSADSPERLVPISDKTRKILWARSGNRCAKCQRTLVEAGTPSDDAAVVGDECHIVSRKGQGPRHDPKLPSKRLDELDNLILLCRNDHKIIDDQERGYKVDAVRKLKSDHEGWVVSALMGATPPAPVRIRRLKQNIPEHLVRLMSGGDVMALIGGANAGLITSDEVHSAAEAELIGDFLQQVQDYGELWSDFGAGERVKATYSVGEELAHLEAVGFWVFGAQENRRLEGGTFQPSSFPVAIVTVLRATDPRIVRTAFGANIAVKVCPH